MGAAAAHSANEKDDGGIFSQMKKTLDGSRMVAAGGGATPAEPPGFGLRPRAFGFVASSQRETHCERVFSRAKFKHLDLFSIAGPIFGPG